MPDTRSPAVSIILPCRNEASHIAACLRGVLVQEEPPGGFEVVIADGMSDDATRREIADVASNDVRVRLIDNPGRIVSTGLNAGIAAARGGVVIRMDAHTEYAPDYVVRCLETLGRTGADNVGGPWVARGRGYLSRAIAAAFQSPFSAGGARGHDARFEGPVDTVYLGCWPRAIFDRIGAFDEEMVRNQDDEFNLRLTLAGGRIHQSPAIRSWYTPRSSLKALFRQYMQYGYWKVRVIKKHGRPASPRHLIPALFVIGIAFGWLGGLVHPGLWVAYAAAIALYALIGLAFSIGAARKAGWDILPVLPFVFATYHVSYGCGFARGIVDFLILRRGPRPSMRTLTRPAAGIEPA